MGKIVVTEFVSLDGVMEDPGGSEDFRRPRRSCSGAGPRSSAARTATGSSKFNNMPKYVVSSTLKDPDWANTTVIDGDLAEEISKVRGEVDGEILVAGSAQLVQALIEEGLVDELRLMVFPVVLGSGKRLFGDMSDKHSLKLTGSQFVGEGVAILRYEPAARTP